jgi:hypothetical protein
MQRKVLYTYPHKSIVVPTLTIPIGFSTLANYTNVLHDSASLSKVKEQCKKRDLFPYHDSPLLFPYNLPFLLLMHGFVFSLLSFSPHSSSFIRTSISFTTASKSHRPSADPTSFAIARPLHFTCGRILLTSNSKDGRVLGAVGDFQDHDGGTGGSGRLGCVGCMDDGCVERGVCRKLAVWLERKWEG